MLVIIIVLVIGIPLLIIIIAILVILILYCCCQKQETTEDELPKSLIENCRRAEPPPEEQGKYLPEPFDASAFQFKGPLIIECPKLHILEHDLTDEKPSGSNINDHVRFDKNLNVAYNIGDNVEIIVRSYGQGIKTGSGEIVKEDGGDEDDEIINEQENDLKQLIIEKEEKGTAKYSKTPNIQSQQKKQKKSERKEASDPRKKSKLVSIHTQKTQISRYSESSTQTLRLNGESPTKDSGTDMRMSKLVLKRDSTIPFKQTTQVSAKTKVILTKEQHGGASLIDASTQTAKSQQWVAEEINPSVSGSPGSQCKSSNISEKMRLEVSKKFIFLR
ncbi:hypothetical protein LOAG_03330 [Loa loa]|uniref:Uncharacterized protein n=1 Tax=Loa loa TaxID=7209 RepID=A0A1I7VP18_LOALO|nr:hypothetical protein LOAG_03330 [Loa loa]EFO25157.1 hypothetical protein LOAG_03330 [Loa loa]